jgi:hypothetical protein
MGCDMPPSSALLLAELELLDSTELERRRDRLLFFSDFFLCFLLECLLLRCVTSTSRMFTGGQQTKGHTTAQAERQQSTEP